MKFKRYKKFFTFKKKDKILLGSSVITVMDAIVTSVDTSLNNGQPLFSTAWALSKGLYGANIQLRQDRALEFVEMIRDNPETFTMNIVRTKEFQDGFVYTFEKFISQRVAEKRTLIKKVFIGYSRDGDKNSFRLERLISTVEQISLEEAEVLKILSDGTIRLWWKSQFENMTDEDLNVRESESLNVGQIGEHILNGIKGMKKFKNEEYTHEVLERLSSLGLVITGVQAKFDVSVSTFKVSSFGREFINFVN